MTRWTTHLRNLVTAEVSRAAAPGAWAHEATAAIEKVINDHEQCSACVGVSNG